MDQQRVKRISLLNVPVDIIQPDQLEEVVKELYSDGKNHQIVLLSMNDLMRARRHGEFRTMVMGAGLILPISLSIIKLAKFLKRELPLRYEPFLVIIELLRIMEHYNKSVYFFGASNRNLKLAEKNIRATFPALRVVGRHSAVFQRSFHANIVRAIHKASPTLLLVGAGVPGGEKWIPSHLKNFKAGLYIWCSDILDVFAEKRFRPPAVLFRHGLEWLYYYPLAPWKFLRIFSKMWSVVVALWYRLRGR